MRPKNIRGFNFLKIKRKNSFKNSEMRKIKNDKKSFNEAITIIQKIKSEQISLKNDQSTNVNF